MATAHDLRNALKTAGYSSRKVTVRDRPCTTETSLQVTIRDASVSLTAVRAVVLPFEHADLAA